MMNVETLKSELNVGRKRRVYIFVGTEKDLLNIYINRINNKTVRVEKLKDIANSLNNKLGLFNGQTYVIDNDNEVLKLSKPSIYKLAEKHTLIFVYDTINTESGFYKSNQDAIFEFDTPTEETLKTYTKATLKTGDKASTIIVRRCGGNMSRVILECDKLKMLGLPITDDLIRQLIAVGTDENLLALKDCIILRQSTEAIARWSKIRSKENALKLGSLLRTTLNDYIVNLSTSAFTTANTKKEYAVGMKSSKVPLSRLKNMVSIYQDFMSRDLNIDTVLAMDILIIKLLK